MANLYGRNSVRFSGMISLISLSGHCRFALSSIFVGSLVVLGVLFFGGSFVGGVSLPGGILMFTGATYSCM